jgi:hypothetical protein
MATVYRIKAIWTGFQGAPGYTTVSFRNVVTQANMDNAQGDLYGFFNAIKAYIPTGTTIQVQKQVDGYDEFTGTLLSSTVSANTMTAVNGTAASVAYAGGSGLCVTWLTSDIYHGHRVKGRTFLVPAVACFDTDGTLNNTALSVVGSAATAFATASTSEAAVWSRVWSDGSPPTQVAGITSLMTGAVVKDAASQLRTRRL